MLASRAKNAAFTDRERCQTQVHFFYKLISVLLLHCGTFIPYYVLCFTQSVMLTRTEGGQTEQDQRQGLRWQGQGQDCGLQDQRIGLQGQGLGIQGQSQKFRP